MIPGCPPAHLSLVMLVLLGTTALARPADGKHKPDPGPPPDVRIEVEPLGYAPPSRAYLAYRYATTTLDFIDDDHLLFTFRDPGLLHRIPDCPPDDEDQIIRVQVLNIASGKPVEQSAWRMHDRHRYLWPLRNGHFLVRQRNSLYLTDVHLELRPYLHFDSPLQLVQISPDRELMVVEVQKFIAPDSDPVQAPAPDSLFARPQRKQKRIEMYVLHPGDNTVLGESESRLPVDLPLIQNGFLNVLEGKSPGEWAIQKEPFRGDPQIIAQFKSSCMPSLMSLSDAVALAVGCPPKGGSDHMVSAISLAGQVLWQDHWKQRYIWPTMDYAEDGSRFAFGSLEINRDLGFMDSFGEEDVTAQMVGVFDTQSGKLQLAKDASPVLSSGHNYALSADGRRFAILRGGAIEIYNLPPVPVETPPASIPSTAATR
jgi:hypothetical protein